jgi:hypothetical protein
VGAQHCLRAAVMEHATAGAFDPTTISGLLLMLRRADLPGPDGSDATTWTDTSGHNRVPTAVSDPFVADVPTYDMDGINGAASLDFDGTQGLKFNEFLYSGNPDGWPGVMTWILLCKWPSVPGGAPYTTMDGLAADCAIRLTSASHIEASTATGTIGAAVTSPTAPKVVTLVLNGASSKLRVNGTEIALGDLGAPQTIGCFWGVTRGATYGLSKLAGVLVYNSALSGTDVTNAESVFRTEGGV